MTRPRRWVADPLALLLLVATGGAVTLVAGGSTLAWWVPALFGVVAAGLALSGST